MLLNFLNLPDVSFGMLDIIGKIIHLIFVKFTFLFELIISSMSGRNLQH